MLLVRKYIDSLATKLVPYFRRAGLRPLVAEVGED